MKYFFISVLISAVLLPNAQGFALSQSEKPIAQASGKTSSKPTQSKSSKRSAKGRKKGAAKKELPPTPLSESKAGVVMAAKEHKTNLENLAALVDEEMKTKTKELEKRKALFDAGIESKKKLLESEDELTLAKAKLVAIQKEIAEADNLITEASAAEQLAKLPPPRIGSYLTTAALIRYSGPSAWTLTNIAKVDSYFVSQFGHSLPISAFGQTATHDRLGLDHRNSVDVAVHPDSNEGQAVMNYLRSAGIPFLAFRQAVPGSATGAHIHIGYPSQRIFVK